MNYNDALNFIINKQRLGIKPGLSRIVDLLAEMGNPQNNLKIIHIAGTNGKGTVAASVAQCLALYGLKAGLFTSPWITDYREQIQINGNFIPKDIFAKYISKYLRADATEFELLTAIMYKYFSDENVDYAVVECGMGGKGDATNAIGAPFLSVITSVSLDHTDFLGNTLDKIAWEKAGIIKNNSRVILYPNPACEAVFEEQCKKTGSLLIKIKEQGDFQKNNFAVIKECLAIAEVNANPVIASLPARQEYITDNIMIDGAHNADGAAALKSRLPDRPITAVIGMMSDKDPETYLSIIAPLCEKIITTTPSNSRALNSERLAEIAKKFCDNVVSVDNPCKALQYAKNNYDFLLICGSFYLARDLRKDLIKTKIR